jgi:two-component system, chemotaxis family, chemotaxis protein CheY
VAAVLVAEDEWVIALTYEDALGAAGHEVVSAADGRAALARAAERRFDLVLTDYMMPRLDGLGFLRELRRLPGYAAVPAILATAIPRANLPPEAEGLCQAVLAKPFRDEALVGLVAGLLRGGPGQAPPDSGASSS